LVMDKRVVDPKDRTAALLVLDNRKDKELVVERKADMVTNNKMELNVVEVKRKVGILSYSSNENGPQRNTS
jgi:hypothetical protein